MNSDSLLPEDSVLLSELGYPTPYLERSDSYSVSISPSSDSPSTSFASSSGSSHPSLSNLLSGLMLQDNQLDLSCASSSSLRSNLSRRHSTHASSKPQHSLLSTAAMAFANEPGPSALIGEPATYFQEEELAAEPPKVNMKTFATENDITRMRRIDNVRTERARSGVAAYRSIPNIVVTQEEKPIRRKRLLPVVPYRTLEEYHQLNKVSSVPSLRSSRSGRTTRASDDEDELNYDRIVTDSLLMDHTAPPPSLSPPPLRHASFRGLPPPRVQSCSQAKPPATNTQGDNLLLSESKNIQNTRKLALLQIKLDKLEEENAMLRCQLQQFRHTQNQRRILPKNLTSLGPTRYLINRDKLSTALKMDQFYKLPQAQACKVIQDIMPLLYLNRPRLALEHLLLQLNQDSPDHPSHHRP